MNSPYLPQPIPQHLSPLKPSKKKVSSRRRRSQTAAASPSTSQATIHAMNTKYSTIGAKKRKGTIQREHLLIPTALPVTSVREDMLVDAAMEKNSMEICQNLLQDDGSNHCPDVNSVHSVHGLTALMAACKFSRSKTVQLLLDYGADPHVERNLNNDTALHFAAKAGCASCILALLHAGAVHEKRDLYGMTASDYAATRPENDAILSLLWAVPVQPGPLRLVVEEEGEEEEEEEEEEDREIGREGAVSVSAMLEWIPPYDNGTKILKNKLVWHRVKNKKKKKKRQ